MEEYWQVTYQLIILSYISSRGSKDMKRSYWECDHAPPPTPPPFAAKISTELASDSGGGLDFWGVAITKFLCSISLYFLSLLDYSDFEYG